MTLNAHIPDWPVSGLEEVSSCPFCASEHRLLLHEDLVDQMFDAPGRWSMMQCQGCGIAYLDPRPTSKTIHIAYRNYYTHEEEASGIQVHGPMWIRKLKEKALRAFYRSRFSQQKWQLSDLLAILVWLKPSFARTLEGEMRNLPKLYGEKRLLDVGCGSGKFMALAREHGWHCVGTEMDPVSIARARANGFEVHAGSVESLADTSQQFDVITLSHVIEHVHDPLSTLTAARKLLSEGGYLWIETPNVAATGHRLNGRVWLGLHPPFHLVIFSHIALKALLSKAGMHNIKLAPWRPTIVPFAQLAQILCPDSLTSFQPRHFGFFYEFLGLLDHSKREFVTLTATRNDAERES